MKTAHFARAASPHPQRAGLKTGAMGRGGNRTVAGRVACLCGGACDDRGAQPRTWAASVAGDQLGPGLATSRSVVLWLWTNSALPITSATSADTCRRADHVRARQNRWLASDIQAGPHYGSTGSHHKKHKVVSLLRLGVPMVRVPLPAPSAQKHFLQDSRPAPSSYGPAMIFVSGLDIARFPARLSI